MTRCVNADIRPDEAVVTDCDRCFIKDGKMEIGKETLSNTNLLAIVTVERLVDDDLFICDVPEQTF